MQMSPIIHVDGVGRPSKTTRPLSTISFNTLPFLKMVLDSLVEQQILSFYFYVPHKPEKDEKKFHAHVYFVPARALVPVELKKCFAEIDPDNPKPRGVIEICFSKFADAYLYAIHDSMYLASKGQRREFHYSRKDVVTNDDDFLDEQIKNIDWNSGSLLREALKSYAEEGVSWYQVVEKCCIPLNNIVQAKTYFESLVAGNLFSLHRNIGKTHETPDIVKYRCFVCGCVDIESAFSMYDSNGKGICKECAIKFKNNH